MSEELEIEISPYIKALPLYKSVPLPDEETTPPSIILGYLPMVMDDQGNVHAYALSEHRVWHLLHTFVVATEEEAIKLYEDFDGESRRLGKFACRSCALVKWPKTADVFADIE